jgi:hypothetical protein
MKIGAQVQFVTDETDTVVMALGKMIGTLGEFLDERCTVTPCGSRVTCDPPTVFDADFDYLVLANADDIPTLVGWLGDAGFVWEGDSQHYKDAAASGFMSWRKDEVNYIVTSDATWAERHKRATLACKRLNLMDKADRVGLFQAVLYGK